MKILYLITQSELGGAQRYIFDLAKNLNSSNIILVASGGENDKEWLAKKLSQENIEYLHLKNLKREISPLNDLKSLFEIRSLIKAFKPDLIHLNSTKISILGSIAPKLLLKKSKIVYTAHGWVFNEDLNTIKKNFYKILERYTAFLKNKILTVSEFDKKTALQLGIKKEKLKTIYNGIKSLQLKTREDARSTLSKHLNIKIKSDDFLIGSIGNLYKNKGFGYLLNSIKQVLSENYNLKLVIIGEGEKREQLMRIIKEEKLEKNVFLSGKIDNASALLSAFDIYVNSSIKEGLSYTILEAMQAKIPIIVTNAGGNPEMIEDGINGFVAEKKDIDDIANKIINLLQNKNKADLFALNSQEKLKQFSLDLMVGKTFNIYKSLTQK